VRYSDFCEIIDEIFTKKAIDKDPLAIVGQFSPETTLPARRHYLVKKRVFCDIILNYFIIFIP